MGASGGPGTAASATPGRSVRAFVVLVAVGALALGACSGEANPSDTTAAGAATTTTTGPQPGADVAVPTVRGPITGGTYDLPFNPMPAALAERYGYVEQEYFVEGDATSYTPTGTWGEDGHWDAVPAATAPYRTRLLVRRPTDPADFSGVVVVEWLNVSSGMDADPDFGFGAEELLRNGDAWVGVSAQAAGVEGGGFAIPIEGFEAKPLREWDPQRYGTLEHPGDDYSFDIFSQAAQAVRRPEGVDPMAGMRPAVVLAAGESQSAMRMVTYVDAVQPLAGIYEGFLIHSRGGSGVAISADATDALPAVAHVRDDLSVPVLQFETETDLFGLGFGPARQPDTDRLRTWEVAGTAHADQHTLDYGFESGRQWDPDTQLDFSSLCGRINDGPQTPVLRAALHGLVAWARDGTAPATAPAIELTADGSAIARDVDGNALGGIRTPAVDAPVATLSGDMAPGVSVICSLFGSTTSFSSAELADRYPTHDDYVAAVTASADAAVDAGHLLRVDADELVAAAREAPVPG